MKNNENKYLERELENLMTMTKEQSENIESLNMKNDKSSTNDYDLSIEDIMCDLNARYVEMNLAFEKIISNEDEYEFKIYERIDMLAQNTLIPFGFTYMPPDDLADLYVFRNYLIGNWKSATINYLTIAISEFICKDLKIFTFSSNDTIKLFDRYTNLSFVGMLKDSTIVTEANYIITQIISNYLNNEYIYQKIFDESFMAILKIRLVKILHGLITCYKYYALAGGIINKNFNGDREQAREICTLPYIDIKTPMFSDKNSKSLNYYEDQKLEIIYSREDK